MAGQARLVSTSARPALQDALTEVRDDMVRQINDATTRQEPRNNRHLREQP
jgi:tartrate dehydratase alpha subunit/fumarate hydratase class I-like protein